MAYYFDVFPVHPSIKSYESLTSYLTRLAEGNRITTLGKLTSLLFPGTSERNTPVLADFPLKHFGNLSGFSTRTSKELEALTFHYLPLRFGRKNDPQATSRFLSGMLSEDLRYCPACIAEQGFYSLFWRFSIIKDCTVHRVQLLEECGHCHNPIPLLTSPLRLGYCPNCNGNLQQCVAQPSSDDLAKTEVRIKDLGFLLTPTNQTSEKWQAMGKLLGQQYAYLRAMKGLAVRDAADLLEETWDRVGGVERGEAYRQGVSFETYWRYADLLDITLTELFERVESHTETNSARRRRVQRQRQKAIAENELKEQVLAAIEDLKRQNQAITQRAISVYTGIAPSSLRYYPEVAGIVMAIVDENRRKNQSSLGEREAALLLDVEAAISKLQTSQERVTQLAISQMVGISVPTLKKYQQIWELLARSLS